MALTNLMKFIFFPPLFCKCLCKFVFLRIKKKRWEYNRDIFREKCIPIISNIRKYKRKQSDV